MVRENKGTGIVNNPEGIGGRPIALTDEKIDAICQLIRDGNYISTACSIVKISTSSFDRYRNKGRELSEKLEAGELKLEELEEGERLQLRFWEELNVADAEAEVGLVKKATTISKRDGRTCIEVLSRRFPERWRSKDRENINVQHSGEINCKNVVEFLLEDIEGIEEAQ